MKPGKLCKRSGKRAYGSHDEAVHKATEIFSRPGSFVTQFRAYRCHDCKCWHLTTH